MSLLGALREILLILFPVVLLALINDFDGPGLQSEAQAEGQAGFQAARAGAQTGPGERA